MFNDRHISTLVATIIRAAKVVPTTTTTAAAASTRSHRPAPGIAASAGSSSSSSSSSSATVGGGDDAAPHHIDTRSMERALSAGIRERTLSKSSLPVVLQRLTKQGHWVAALYILQSPSARQGNIIRDDGLWALVRKDLPCEDARRAADVIFKRTFATSKMHSLKR